MLHRFVVNANSALVVDHYDHNTLNNRKYNLRIAEKSNNEKNRKSKNSNNKSGYRNVSMVDGKWIVQLQIKGKNTRLGSFDDVHEAGEFAKEMREKYYGEFAGKD